MTEARRSKEGVRRSVVAAAAPPDWDAAFRASLIVRPVWFVVERFR